MAKTAAITVRFEPEVKAALERAAADDNRETAIKAELILRQWLRENGYLNGKKAKR